MVDFVKIETWADRNNIPEFLIRNNCLETGVEVGTHRGDFAKVLLSKWPGRLYCIDPWDHYDPVQVECLPRSDGDREKDFTYCVNQLQNYSDRVELIRDTSFNAAGQFEDQSVDFVYIDGDHSYEAVLQDLKTWWWRLRDSGFLFGHDVHCPGEVDGGWAKYIVPAITDFAEQMKVPRVYKIPETANWPWSFVIPRDGRDLK